MSLLVAHCLDCVNLMQQKTNLVITERGTVLKFFAKDLEIKKRK